MGLESGGWKIDREEEKGSTTHFLPVFHPQLKRMARLSHAQEKRWACLLHPVISIHVLLTSEFRP